MIILLGVCVWYVLVEAASPMPRGGGGGSDLTVAPGEAAQHRCTLSNQRAQVKAEHPPTLSGMRSPAWQHGVPLSCVILRNVYNKPDCCHPYHPASWSERAPQKTLVIIAPCAYRVSMAIRSHWPLMSSSWGWSVTYTPSNSSRRAISFSRLKITSGTCQWIAL